MANFWETDKIELQMTEGVGEGVSMEDFRLYFDIWDTDGNYVGFAHVDKMDARVGRCELFVGIEEKEQGKGYGMDAARLVMDYLFSYKRYHRIACQTSEPEKCQGFLEKLGFTQEGVWHGMRMGQDVSVYSILEEEYAQDIGNRNIPSEVRNKSELMMSKKLCQMSENGDATEKKVMSADSDTNNEAQKLPTSKPRLHLANMTKAAYHYKHELYFDQDASLMLDGTVNLPKNPEVLSDWEKKHLGGKQYGDCMEYAIRDHRGELIGTAGLDGIDHFDSKFSYHIYIFAEYTGAGYGTEALYLLLHEGFVSLGLHKMYTYIDADNQASLRIAMKNGCQVEGVARAMEFYKGKYANDLMVGMTQEAFLTLYEETC